MRSSRETELAETFPTHVVCAWIGNSEPIAAKHYLQVTDDHFAQAVQNPVQYAQESDRRTRDPESETPVFPAEHDPLLCYTDIQIAEAGLEPARGTSPQDFKS